MAPRIHWRFFGCGVCPGSRGNTATRGHCRRQSPHPAQTRSRGEPPRRKTRKRKTWEKVTQSETNFEKPAHPRARTLSPEQLLPRPSGCARTQRDQPREAAARRAHRGQPDPQAPDHLRGAPPGRCARPTARPRPPRGGHLTRPRASASRSTRSEVASHPCHRGAGKVPGCGLPRPPPSPALSERRRAGPARHLPGSKSANSGCGRMRGANLPGAASPQRGSLTHLRRRRPPAPPAPAPLPTAAASASRPPPRRPPAPQ